MSLSPGTSLGHYDVTSLLGEGGMGQVWQATDTQLNRQVALKILPDAFAADPDRLARFTREAQILASLNHPNIAAIYGIEEAEGTRALVLELVEGSTLADRIAKGPIPLDEALPIAKQIAEALEAAHEAGVIHRDLKPANIKVREDGTVKVLDFGLAKALDPAPDVDPSQSPTLTAAATQMGVIMGTAAYMSPEQARGKVVDRRADIWSFGVVLLEMLTGKRVFEGDDVSLTLADVMRAEPAWERLPNGLPPALDTYLRRCLEKDPRQRVQAIGDVRLAMEGAFETPATASSEPMSASPLPVWQRPAGIAGVGLAALVVGGAVMWSLPRSAPLATHPLSQFALRTPPESSVIMANNDSEVATSSDGTRIVYGSQAGGRATRQLYTRHVGELDATLLRGTEGGHAPIFSPDSQSIAFEVDNALRRVSVLGGPAVTIVEDQVIRGKSWGPDDVIVFNSASGLMRVPAVGGEPEPLTTLDPAQDEFEHRWPDVLPNGKGVLFTAWTGSVEDSRLAVVSLETGAITYLLSGGSFPRYVLTGHIVYAVGGTLWAVGFDADRLVLTSNNPTPVMEDVAMKGSGAGNFDVSAGGSLVYVKGTEFSGFASRALVWVDRAGNEEPLEAPVLAYERPRVSPDGTRVAVDVADPEDPDIWLHDLARGTETRFTIDPANDSAPLWTPDGERLVFASDREGELALFWKPVDALGDAERLVSVSAGRAATVLEAAAWSADGRTLLFWEDRGVAGPDTRLLSMEGERTSEALLEDEFGDGGPAISPDGAWLAYHSDETGEAEVYVQRFPALGAKMTISTDGGMQPLWSPDGDELFYRGPRGMMAVPVETAPTFRVGDPEVLFEDQYYFSRSSRTYDLAPDGQRFLMVSLFVEPRDDGGAEPQIVLVENWFQELERLVPTN